VRAVIIDDEQSLRESNQTLLAIYCPEVEVCGFADGVKSGIELIQKEQPDLALLDVEMKDGTGFDVANAFPDRNFAVIFATGHDEYALKAFKLSAVDYLLKPVDPDELVKAVEKAKNSLSSGLNELQLKTLQSNLSNKKVERILLKDAEKVYLVDLKDIVRCTSDDNYTRFFLVDGKELLISNTLKEYETLFEGMDFFRSHQSHLINLNYFSFFEKKDGGSIHLKDGSIVPVSVRKKDQLFKILDTLK
jgi:two-component system LytT family response regulator